MRWSSGRRTTQVSDVNDLSARFGAWQDSEPGDPSSEHIENIVDDALNLGRAQAVEIERLKAVLESHHRWRLALDSELRTDLGPGQLAGAGPAYTDSQLGRATVAALRLALPSPGRGGDVSDGELTGWALNAEVGHRVFGLEVDIWPGGWMYRIDNGFMPLPDYSGSVSAAWTVVERMRELEYWLVLQDRWTGLETRDGYAVAFGHAIETFDGSASTVEVAICRAALKAMEDGS